MYFKEVKKVQYIQEDRNTLLIKYTGKNDLKVRDDVLKQIKKLSIHYDLKENLNIKIKRVGEITSDSVTKKYRTIIPYTG